MKVREAIFLSPMAPTTWEKQHKKCHCHTHSCVPQISVKARTWEQCSQTHICWYSKYSQLIIIRNYFGGGSNFVQGRKSGISKTVVWGARGLHPGFLWFLSFLSLLWFPLIQRSTPCLQLSLSFLSFSVAFVKGDPNPALNSLFVAVFFVVFVVFCRFRERQPLACPFFSTSGWWPFKEPWKDNRAQGLTSWVRKPPCGCGSSTRRGGCQSSVPPSKSKENKYIAGPSGTVLRGMRQCSRDTPEFTRAQPTLARGFAYRGRVVDASP